MMTKRKHQIKNFSDWDVRFLLSANMVEIENGAVRWLDEEYDGLFNDVRELAEAGRIHVNNGVWEVTK